MTYRGKILYVVLFFLASNLAFAGVRDGGGGDSCEDRFKIVRDDAISWIAQGGPSGLALPPTLPLQVYIQGISDKLAKAKISCTADKVMIGSAEKTCVNFVDSSGDPEILCNFNRFLTTSEADQYVLVHHEYASLAGFEKPDGENSTYTLSNQLSEYLVDEIVKKLALKQPKIVSGKNEVRHVTLGKIEASNFTCEDGGQGANGVGGAANFSLTINDPFFPDHAEDARLTVTALIPSNQSCAQIQSDLQASLPLELELTRATNSYLQYTPTSCRTEEISNLLVNIGFINDQNGGFYSQLMKTKVSKFLGEGPLSQCAVNIIGRYQSGSSALATCSGYSDVQNLYLDRIPKIDYYKTSCAFTGAQPEPRSTTGGGYKFKFSITPTSSPKLSCVGDDLTNLFCFP